MASRAQIQDEHFYYLNRRFWVFSLHTLLGAQVTVQHYIYNNLDGPAHLAIPEGNLTGYSKQLKGVKQDFDT